MGIIRAREGNIVCVCARLPGVVPSALYAVL